MPVNLTRRGATKAPTPEYIDLLRQEMDMAMAPVRRRWELIRQVRDRKHELSIPPAFQKTTREIRTHFVGDIIRRVVSTLTVNFPIVSSPPSGPSDERQRNSTLREKWSNAALLQLDAERMPKRPYRWTMDHAVTYGVGIWKLVFTPTAWHDYPTAKKMFGKRAGDLSEEEAGNLQKERDEYKRGKLPFAWQSVDPRTWYGFWTEGRLRECIEVTERTVQDLTSAYAVRYDPQSDKIRPESVGEAYAEGTQANTGWTKRLFIQHWNDTYCTETCDGEILAQWRHGYQRVPYFPFYGLANATADPGQEMESVVEHIVDIVQAYDQLLTIWTNWAYMSGFPMGTVEADAQSAPLAEQIQQPDAVGEGQVLQTIEFEPGKFKALPPGHKLGWVVPPPVGQDIIKVSDVLRSFIAEVIPNVMKGVSGGDQPGYAIRQLIDAARLVYDPITDNASMALEAMIKHAWWLVENKVKEDVYVFGESTDVADRSGRWLALGPNDIYKYYACKVSIKPLLPSTLISDGQFGLQQVQGGAISMETHRQKFLGIEAPEEEDTKVRKERVLNDPNSPLNQWITQEAIKRAGLMDEQEAAQRRAAFATMPLPAGMEQRFAMDQQTLAMMQQQAQQPQMPPGAGGPMAPQPGLGMPLQQPEPPMPGMPAGVAGPGMPGPGAPAMGGPSGMPGGRAAGEGTNPPMREGM